MNAGARRTKPSRKLISISRSRCCSRVSFLDRFGGIKSRRDDYTVPVQVKRQARSHFVPSSRGLEVFVWRSASVWFRRRRQPDWLPPSRRAKEPLQRDGGGRSAWPRRDFAVLQCSVFREWKRRCSRGHRGRALDQ